MALIPNNRINLTRISRVRFWALLVAQAGYANRSAGTKQKCCPRRTLGAELHSSRLARRLTVEIK